jgi:hypothetical protein
MLPKRSFHGLRFAEIACRGRSAVRVDIVDGLWVQASVT